MDASRVLAARDSATVGAQVERAAAQARAAGVTATPTFQVARRGQPLHRLEVPALDVPSFAGPLDTPARQVSARAARIAIAALALVGISITTYLLYTRYSGNRIACPTGGCETVQESRYAELAGIPVAAIGLVGYLALLVTTFVRSEAGRAAAVAISLAGLGLRRVSPGHPDHRARRDLRVVRRERCRPAPHHHRRCHRRHAPARPGGLPPRASLRG